MIFFTIFVGLFDKDTRTQIIDTKDAEKDIAEVCAERFGGATISRCMGVYKHHDGEVVMEPSIRIEVAFVTEELARSVAAELRDKFNQESVGFKPDCKPMCFI